MFQFRKNLFHSLFLFNLFLALSLSSGCSDTKQEVAVIEGTVSVDGKPANSGDVVFAVKEMNVSGPIQADGSFKVVGIPLGNAKVYLMPPPKAISKTNAPPLEGTGGKQGGGPPVAIPAKYLKAETSGLTFDVKSGKNTCPLQLSSR